MSLPRVATSSRNPVATRVATLSQPESTPLVASRQHLSLATRCRSSSLSPLYLSFFSVLSCFLFPFHRVLILSFFGRACLSFSSPFPLTTLFQHRSVCRVVKVEQQHASATRSRMQQRHPVVRTAAVSYSVPTPLCVSCRQATHSVTRCHTPRRCHAYTLRVQSSYSGFGSASDKHRRRSPPVALRRRAVWQSSRRSPVAPQSLPVASVASYSSCLTCQ